MWRMLQSWMLLDGTGGNRRDVSLQELEKLIKYQSIILFNLIIISLLLLLLGGGGGGLIRDGLYNRNTGDESSRSAFVLQPPDISK